MNAMPSLDPFITSLKPGQPLKLPFPPDPVYLAGVVSFSPPSGPHVFVSENFDPLHQLHQALRFFEPCQKVFFFSKRSLKDLKSLSPAPLNEEACRIQWLAQAAQAKKTDIFLITEEGLFHNTLPPRDLKRQNLTVKAGHPLPGGFFKKLKKLSYISRDRVEASGEFSFRGAVLDIYSPLSGPLRMELIGEEVLTIKTFDPHHQKSLESLQEVCLPPLLYSPPAKTSSGPKSFISLDHFQSSIPLLWHLEDSPSLLKSLSLNQRKKIREVRFSPSFFKREKPLPKQGIVFPFTVPDNRFFKNPREGVETIQKSRGEGFLVFLATGGGALPSSLNSSLKQAGFQLLKEDLWPQMRQEQTNNPRAIHIIERALPGSVVLNREKVYLLRVPSRNPQTKPAEFFLPDKIIKSLTFSELRPGDLAVHKQQGIGQFQSLKVFNFGTGPQEFLVLNYRGQDKLYVPVYNIHQIQKYTGSRNKNFIDKLGDKRWLNTRQRVKNRLRDMTLELIRLYSLRTSVHRKPFPKDSPEFKKFEADFPFQETPDQMQAIADTLKDLTECPFPSDRLICGDVGFGKTEVAMRAAFKVVEAGFQVCLMAPTTILSFQHFRNFQERFKKWAVHIQLLNRFCPAQTQKQILKQAREGRLDILIGTHRLLSRELEFKNPGLLIIDEEHLFGVKSKERLKLFKSSLDTLSLSATPIPRSLSMSLSGLRPLSVINTPPLNRQRISTTVHVFHIDLIKEAVFKELKRGGQILFVHNRIQDIHTVADTLKKHLPKARVRVAHGKMKELQSRIVLDFFHHRFDMLVCTTIMESGMDFSLAGTLFINEADDLGLSQLHQLRGRIGRSERKSYCYLLLKPHKKIQPPALKRLQILQENNHPGAGLMIARHDLQMRGGGDLMGSRQSGFLGDDVGFEMYFELLKENIQTLCSQEPVSPPEPDLFFNVAAFLPESHLPHEKIRLLFYKKLSFAASLREIDKLREEIRDFMGPLPPEAENLITLSRCRLKAKQLHIREINSRPPFLYVNFSKSTPLKTGQILKWVEEGKGTLSDTYTLKIPFKKESLKTVLCLLEELHSKTLNEQLSGFTNSPDFPNHKKKKITDPPGRNPTRPLCVLQTEDETK